MSKKLQIRNSTAEFLIFTTQSAEKSIEARYEDETVWLSQKLMATLFEVEVNTINYHLKEIFKAEELQENSVIRNFRITAADGKNYNTQFYNLDAIISVGSRVNSEQMGNSSDDSKSSNELAATGKLTSYEVKEGMDVAAEPGGNL